jgi:hypothetical protein
MKITELLIESQQLDEGPIAQALGRGVGKVARGVANIGKDVKAGFKTGYSGEQPADDQTVAAPAKPNATAQGIKQGLNRAFKAKAFDTPKTAKDINAQGPAGTAPAKAQTGAAAAAIDKTAQATAGQSSEKVGQTLYAQVKAQVNQLDKNTNLILNTFNSITEAALFINPNKFKSIRSSIESAVNPNNLKQTAACGYKWEYVNSLIEKGA